MAKRSKVLMIGWFSSSISYVQTDTICLDLIDELKQLVEMTVIIPRFNTKAMVNGVKIIDLEVTKGHIEDAQGAYKFHSEEEQQDERYVTSGSKVFSNETQVIANPKYREELFASTMKFSEFVLEEISNSEYDIIHVQDWLSFPAAVAAKKMLDIPLVIQGHSLESEKAENTNKNYINSIEKESLDFADVILMPSKYGQNILINKYDISPQKIRIVPNGIKTSVRVPKKETKPYNLVLILSRLIHESSPEYLVDVVRKVVDFVPNVHFVMAGSTDDLSPILEMVTNAQITDRLMFTGPLDSIQTAQLLKLTDVYVLPAVSEPFGSTVLEAIQHNIPCVVSNQSGVSELLRHTLKCDFWDTEKLASQIISILKHSALREEMVDNAKGNIKDFDWYQSATKINEVYKEIIH